MQCVEFEQLWNEALDNRGNPRELASLQSHATLCPACAELLLGSDAILTVFSRRTASPTSRPVLTAPVAFTERALDAWLLAEQTASAEAPADTFPLCDLVTQHGSVGGSPVMPMAATISRPRRHRWVAGWWVAGGTIAAALAAVAAFSIPTGNPDRVADHPTPALVTVQPSHQPLHPLDKPRPNGLEQPSPHSPVAPVPPLVSATPATDPTDSPGGNRHPSQLTWSSSLALSGRLQPQRVTWVGYEMADRIKPVTNGMSAAIDSLKKPLGKSNEMHMSPDLDQRPQGWNLNRSGLADFA
ncbi:MAG: hypothetical protein SFX18_09175 [Pirellulales bacterium]|nr:hypothetical protein [Pirellulales bacterium]